MKIQKIQKPPYEADDIIGSLSKQFEKEKTKTLIISNDHDFNQLLSPEINIYRNINKQIIDMEYFKSHNSITPEQFSLYLSLCGDPTDNIPGIEGFGPKRAAKVLVDTGAKNISQLYENLHTSDLNQNFKDKLKSNIDTLYLMKELTTIKTELVISNNLEEFIRNPFTNEFLEYLYDTKFFSLFSTAKLLNKQLEKKNLVDN